MRIPIHGPKPPSTPVESPLPPLLSTPLGLALLEIQGTLNLPNRTSDSDSDRIPIGRLEFPLLTHQDSDGAEAKDGGLGAEEGPWMKKVFLHVGTAQRLTGEVKKLPKAVAVLRRKQGGGDEEGDSSVGGREEEDELEVVEIVRFKLLFASRPEFV